MFHRKLTTTNTTQSTSFHEVVIVATRHQINDQEKVKSFLDTVGRNSLKTRKNYETTLVHFQEFLNRKYDTGHTLQTILDMIVKNEFDIYRLFDNFIAFENSNVRTLRGREMRVTPQTIRTILIGIKSYLAYYDIDIIPSKFRRKVKLPKIHREDEEPLDYSDIRRILLACSNRRLRAYLLVLASGGMRASEALSIRLRYRFCYLSHKNPYKKGIRQDAGCTRHLHFR